MSAGVDRPLVRSIEDGSNDGRASVAPEAFILVLTAATLHAAWNALMKSSDDRLVSVWAITCTGGVLNLGVLAIVGLPEAKVLPPILASVMLHVIYASVLVKAYERADLSVAYPIARGTAPLLVTIFGISVLADSVSTIGIFGVVLITLGLGALAGGRAMNSIGWAGVTGLAIASYTIVDGYGVRLGDESVRYIATMSVGQSLLLTIIVLFVRGPQPMAAAAASEPVRTILGGAASTAAYLLVMIAARTEALGLVVGLRETSAIFGLLLGRLVLGEETTIRQGLAIGFAACGAVAIAVS